MRETLTADGAGPIAARMQDDAQGMLSGTLFVALGIHLFGHAGLVPGGTVGLALVLHYVTGWQLPWMLALVNVPFLAFAWRRLGAAFTARSVAAVAMLTAMTWALPFGIGVTQVSAPAASLLGGLLVGAGLLFLFRHRASLGGFNVLALHAQERFGWRAGHVQMALDAAIVVAGGLLTGDLPQLAWSVVAVVLLNLVLVFNHRADRYRPA